MSLKPIIWDKGKLFLLDQTILPTEKILREYSDYRAAAQAITDMVVRGAPAIGVTAALALALAANELAQTAGQNFFAEFDDACRVVAQARPTAVNLFWAVDRIKVKADSLKSLPPQEIAAAIEREAVAMLREDVEINKKMGRNGAALLPDKCNVLTHCNAGALATAGYGTALGVIRAAVEAGKKIHVFADETRPFLQGARLTAWELMADNIPTTLIADNAAGYNMKLGKVDAVVVGADRIASNGDAANKIGTYSLSVLAKENNVPFYIAAPLSTIDFSLKGGDEIPIEERSPDEVSHCGGTRIAPEGVGIWNPAFDVTPSGNISAIITEAGVAKAPFVDNLKALLD